MKKQQGVTKDLCSCIREGRFNYCGLDSDLQKGRVLSFAKKGTGVGGWKNRRLCLRKSFPDIASMLVSQLLSFWCAWIGVPTVLGQVR